MNEKEYLEAVLRAQTLVPNGPEILELQRQRDNVTKVINEKLGRARPEVRRGGSWAKNTMILEAYDLDLPTYFSYDETGAGETLEEIYNAVAQALSDDYFVERRRSALRLRSRDASRYQEDTHIDLVPGRFFDDSRSDAWIYQNGADKCRLKTNLDIHVDHIRESGVRPAIRLGKLWNIREQVGLKTFVLELLIVDLLRRRKDAALADQFKYIMEQFRDQADNLSVSDPANGNNDLTPALIAVKPALVSAASSVLWRLNHTGWEAVFGPILEEDRGRSIAHAASAVATTQRYKPWSSER